MRKGKGKISLAREEVLMAYEQKIVDQQAKIKVRLEGKLWETTVGRVLMYSVFPEQFGFEHANRVMDKKSLGKLVDDCFRICGNKATVLLSDRLKNLGYQHATLGGISIAHV